MSGARSDVVVNSFVSTANNKVIGILDSFMLGSKYIGEKKYMGDDDAGYRKELAGGLRGIGIMLYMYF